MSSQTEQAQSLIPGASGPAPSVPPAAVQQGTRLLFIDNLRVLLICGVVVEHLAVTYGGVGSWYYHDPATTLLTAILLTILTGIGIATGMGSFFLIAGYFTPGSYDRKGAASFLRDRLVRLGIPLLLYDLLLDPLVVYIADGLQGLAANAYTVYLIHPLVLVSFAYAFHTVALYPLLKFVISVLITLPLCFLISSFIRKIPLADRIL